jgi:adenosylcobinamide-phosphate synthase
VTAWAYPFFAFVLDLVIGDPRWIPHPVVIIGKGVSWVEASLRRCFHGSAEKVAGVILVLVIVLLTAGIAFALERFLLSLSGNVTRIVGTVLFTYLASTTLALRGLVGSANQVRDAVERGNLMEARQRLSLIVGRDTEELEEDAILRATIETVAENLSDGFVAPLFYLVLGGLPLAFAYKAINTLDSMVGYKNERYLRLGWAAARLDDVANYIPARITGVSIAAVTVLCQGTRAASTPALRTGLNSFRIMRRDGRKHTSPNSGVSEAAMAGALGVRLGGPSTYGGILMDKPYIGDAETTNYREAASLASSIAVIASTCLTILSVGFLFVLRNMP